MGCQANWVVPKIWDDGECWIIGGGPSFPRQFGVPEAIIEKVMRKEINIGDAYNPYLEPIKSKHIIGTNIAFYLGDWVDILYFPDMALYRTHKFELLKYRGLQITDTGSLPSTPRELRLQKNIRRLKRDSRNGLTTNPAHLCWNRNAGGGAINLAINLGATKIRLLGYDMNTTSDGTSHWHAGFTNYDTPTPDRTLGRFLKEYPQIAVEASKLGIEILNVNLSSALECFPKVTLKEVL